MRLAIVSTHPIQYNAPFFRLLAKTPGLDIHVFYTWEQSASGPKFDPGFGKKIEWDIPLLDGYEYSFVKNTSKRPGSDHFWGIVNPDLISHIKAWHPDILLIYGWSFYSHLTCMRYFHGKIPVWFRGDSTLLDEQRGVRKIIRRLLLRWVYHYVDKALYVGEYNRKYFVAHGLKEEELLFVPHAIDNERFSEPTQEYEQKAKAWRDKLGIPHQDRVILFAGKFESKKNPFFLIELAKAFQLTNIWILLVGNGPLEASLKIAAKDLDRVIFLDFQNQQQMPVLYRMADVFILPSKGPGETWGLAVNEAMACSRPVVVSKKCGCSADLIEVGSNGWLVDPDRPDAIMPEIKKLLNSDDMLREYGRASSRRIENYSMTTAVNIIAGALGRN